jgi:hypothetical protein
VSAIYFTEQDGARGAIMIVNVADSSKIPALARLGYKYQIIGQGYVKA